MVFRIYQALYYFVFSSTSSGHMHLGRFQRPGRHPFSSLCSGSYPNWTMVLLRNEFRLHLLYIRAQIRVQAVDLSLLFNGQEQGRTAVLLRGQATFPSFPFQPTDRSRSSILINVVRIDGRSRNAVVWRQSRTVILHLHPVRHRQIALHTVGFIRVLPQLAFWSFVEKERSFIRIKVVHPRIEASGAGLVTVMAKPQS